LTYFFFNCTYLCICFLVPIQLFVVYCCGIWVSLAYIHQLLLYLFNYLNVTHLDKYDFNYNYYWSEFVIGTIGKIYKFGFYSHGFFSFVCFSFGFFPSTPRRFHSTENDIIILQWTLLYVSVYYKRRRLIRRQSHTHTHTHMYIPYISTPLFQNGKAKTPSVVFSWSQSAVAIPFRPYTLYITHLSSLNK